MATILIIDDQSELRQLLRVVLEGAGHEVLEAGDGNAGLVVVDDRAVDVIITDIVMPEKEGLETIMELRRRHAAAQIIAISGGGVVEPQSYLGLAQRLGAKRCFAKPFDVDELVSAVEELLIKGPFHA